MKIITSLDNIKQNFGLTIGNFDGVHLGHQSLIREMKSELDLEESRLAVVTFVPHPHQVLNFSNGHLISSYEKRQEFLKELGVDYLWEIPFTRDFSALGPKEFMNQFILTNSKLRKLFIGHDFAFGSKKSGGHEIIRSLLKGKDLEHRVMPKYTPFGLPISSSRVRTSINSGDVFNAAKMLGRPFTLSGNVIKGQGRGKTIGFPTANLNFEAERIVPKKGVYLSKALLNRRYYPAITNVGVNPTFNDGPKIHVETHLLDFQQDIYGEMLEVDFLDYIREEMAFDGVDSLISQIRKDVKRAYSYFNL